MNPLFDDSHDARTSRRPKDTGYLLSRQSGKVVKPLSYGTAAASGAPSENPQKNAAIELIRKKLETVYEDEPDAKEEIQEVEQAVRRSPHQQVMYDLSNSGMSLAEIQKAWHAYYGGLSDQGKHEVWREFYANNEQQTPGAAAHQKAVEKHAVEAKSQKESRTEKIETRAKTSLQLHPESAEDKEAKQTTVVTVEHEVTPPVPDKTPKKPSRTSRGSNLLRKHVIEKVKLSAIHQEKAKQHFHSLLFGIGFGAIAVVIFLFSFFNEMIIAPFIQPSRKVSTTPIILTSDSVAVGETPEVIIPKINVQIPVDYTQQSVQEEAVQASLENGVVHYASTSQPGEQGNTAIFGHSSNNIFNKGKYKFAFVKLSELVPGDIFYLTKDKKIYSYRVYDKRIVTPQQTEVLRPVEGKVTATLITCDPPGTSTNRLVVWGEQISPDPASANVAAAPPAEAVVATEPAQLSGNSPTLWSRLTKWLF